MKTIKKGRTKDKQPYIIRRAIYHETQKQKHTDYEYVSPFINTDTVAYIDFSPEIVLIIYLSVTDDDFLYQATQRDFRQLLESFRD